MTNQEAIEILDAMIAHQDRRVRDATERAVRDRARKANHLAAARDYTLEGLALVIARNALKGLGS